MFPSFGKGKIKKEDVVDDSEFIRKLVKEELVKMLLEVFQKKERQYQQRF